MRAEGAEAEIIVDVLTGRQAIRVTAHLADGTRWGWLLSDEWNIALDGAEAMAKLQARFGTTPTEAVDKPGVQVYRHHKDTD